MEYILQFARILGFCVAGEALHHLLPLPIPASIYGLLLLFLALETGLLKVQQVKAASAWLIAVFAVMFVPGTVGVMELWDVMARLLVPILLAVFVITALVFLVTGHVTQGLLFASGYAAQTLELRKRTRQSELENGDRQDKSEKRDKPDRHDKPDKQDKPGRQDSPVLADRQSGPGNQGQSRKGKPSKHGRRGKKGGRKS